MRALEGLNGAQQEAVRTVDGPLLILAGPGSGKTRVIVHRIAHLLELGVRPHSVLAVTFTNKAAREMRERLQALVGVRADGLSVGTFHATCARWLRREIHLLGYAPGFAIYDANDQVDLMKRMIRDLELDEKRYSPRSILHEISSAKSELHNAQDYARRADGRWQKTVASAYERYQAALEENQALDFDDLLILMVRVFQEFPDVLARYQERFQYLLVDEFQDTNIVQYQLARFLAQKYRNICVVGDPDQSIYGWRKADIRNILDFENDYPDLKVVVLEQNYRSSGTILELAHAVISANELRKEKNLWTENDTGTAVTLLEAHDEREEAQFVVREIERLRALGGRPGEVAVMYRTNAQSRAVEDTFVRYGVPYRLVGGTRFYERKEVKDVLAYLRLVINPRDSLSLQRIANVPPRGIGPKTVAELGRWSADLGIAPFEALQRLAGATCDGAAEDESVPFGTRARFALSKFVHLVETLREEASVLPPHRLIDLVLERGGYERFLRDGTEEGEERWSNVVELRTKSRDFADLQPEVALQRFLEEVSLVQDVDSLQGESDAVTLITLHAAKGLEFPQVFILGVEEGLCPHVRSLDDQQQMEEERRLFYVGVTRAMQGLYLVYANYRSSYMGWTEREPSRFLRDIPARLLKLAAPRARQFVFETDDEAAEHEERSEHPGRARATSTRVGLGLGRARPAPAARAETAAPLAALATPREPTFRKGDRVRHSAFGEGVVLESTMVGDDEQVNALFRGHPTPKKLSLRFAPLERV